MPDSEVTEARPSPSPAVPGIEVTEVRVTVTNEPRPGGRLLGAASVVLNGGFAVRELKLIELQGGVAVAMPDRPILDHCPWCGGRNRVLARYCDGCGAPLQSRRVGLDSRGRMKAYQDICHPINRETREAIDGAVLGAYRGEVGGKGVAV